MYGGVAAWVAVKEGRVEGETGSEAAASPVVRTQARVLGESGDDAVFAETAWNLYRAIREYPAFRESLHTSHELAVGQREPQGENEPLSSGEATRLARHARWVVARHNLDDPRVADVIGGAGVNALTWAVEHELRTGAAITFPDFWNMMLMESPVRFPPLSVTVAGITINPFAYRDETAFMAHMNEELPRLYREIIAANEREHTHRAEAEQEVADHHHRVLTQMAQRLSREKPADLRAAYLRSDHPSMQATLRAMGYSPSDAKRGARYLLYISRGDNRDDYWRPRRSCIRQFSDHDGWWWLPDAPDLNEEVGPRLKGRENPYSALPTHARWWAAHKVDKTSQRALAAAEGVSSPNVNQRIHELERRFAVA